MIELSPDYFDQVHESLGKNRGLPSELYSDPNWFALEKEAILTRRWYYVGPIQNLTKSGDTLLGYADNIPVIVTKDRAGQIHALVNICRHRAHPVCQKDGNHSSLVCPYHAWTYNLDGSLRGAPGTQTDPSFDKADNGLMKLPVTVWGSCVFVAPSADLPSMSNLMPAFDRLVERRKIVTDPDRYVHYRRYSLEMDVNWKIYYDNALECYHCPTVHRGTFNDVYVTSDDYETLTDRWLVSYYFPPKSAKPGQDLQISFNRHIHVVPGFFCHQQDDIMIVYQMRVLSPTKVAVHWDIFSDVDGNESRVSRWADLWYKTLDEDKHAVEAVQRSIDTGLFTANRFVAEKEPSLIDHSRWILEECQDLFDRRVK